MPHQTPSVSAPPGSSDRRSVSRLGTALAILSILPAALAPPLAAQAPHCGTGLWMQKRLKTGHALPSRAAARAVAAQAVRTFETPHFAIRYVLRGLNQAHTDAEDKAFTDLVDSMYETLPSGLSEGAADSTVYSMLDAAGAGHPRFIQAMGTIFESAYRYYVDTLGMRPPAENHPQSIYYEAPALPGGKYPVDVADIGTADPSFFGQEIYALTYPPGYGGMLMENDFLFRTRLDTATGRPRGDSISSRYQGAVLHNYAVEWELGLRVTCYHELYHTVQFAYTPHEDRFHLWYETSATGMEERKAPEVDDYLQYLPAYMEDLATIGMHAFPDGGLSRYGNAVYHLFLTRELGEDFDVKLWGTLATNGNNIKAALAATYAAYGLSAQEVYARYAAQLAFSGKDAANPLVPFSSDIPRWPPLPSVEVDLGDASAQAFSTILAPTSIRALSLRRSGNSGMALVQPDTLLRVTLARLDADSSTVATYSGRIVSLDLPGEPGDALAVLSNGDQTRPSRTVQIRSQSSRLDSTVYPYPNPMARAAVGGDLIFSRLSRPAAVTVYTESGVPLRALAFGTDKALWSWDLADALGRKVKPGLYYYRVDGGGLKPFYLK